MGNTARTEQRAFLVFLGLLILLGLYLFSPFLEAIILGVVLAVLFQPLHSKFLRWTRNRPNLSAVLSTLSVVVLLLIPVAIILTLVTGQLTDLIAPKESAATQPSLSEFLGYLQQKLTSMGRRFERLVGLQMQLAPMIRKGMSDLAQAAARYSPQVIAGTANVFLNFFVMLIVLLYLFRDGKKFIVAVIRLTPIKDTYEHKLALEIQETIKGIFYGNFVAGLVQALLAGLGFFFLGIEGYFVWASVTFLMSFLPTIGTGAVIVPMVVVLFLQGHATKALVLAVYGAIIIGSVDNLLRPLLMSRHLHPMFLFLAVFGGLAVFGPIGLLVGPMVLALLAATVRIYAEDFAQTTLPSLERHPRRKEKASDAASDA